MGAGREGGAAGGRELPPCQCRRRDVEKLRRRAVTGKFHAKFHAERVEELLPA
jgi:hypothetical protein